MRSPAVAPSSWHRLAVPPRELRLDTTLENGQCFGWHRQPGDGDASWVGVLGRRLLEVRETETDCLFRCLGDQSGAGDDQSAAASLCNEVRQFFQLDTPLAPLYEKWSRADCRMAAVAKALPGMRVLRQEPSECLFSFICSSNNNIGRIAGMLESLRRRYGTPIAVTEPADVDTRLAHEHDTHPLRGVSAGEGAGR